MERKGFGETLPTVDSVHTVTAKVMKGSGGTLIDLQMRCHYAVALFPLSAWGSDLVKMSARAWMISTTGGYWGWGPRSFAWPISADDWEYQLLIAGKMPNDTGMAEHYAALINARERMRCYLRDIETALTKIEIDDLR